MPNFPFYKQLDSKDCGPTCIRIIANHYGRSFSTESIRKLTFMTREGVSLLAISNSAEALGFRTLGSKINFDQLKECQLPLIAHWRQKHFVVVYKITNNKVYVSDPAFGLITYKTTDFLEGWLSKKNDEKIGVVLLMEPTPKFYEAIETEKKISFSFFLNYLRPFKSFYFQLFLGMFVGLLFSLITPFLTQSIVDIGINNQNIGFIQMVMIAQVMLAISSTVLGFVRSWIFLHMGSRMSIAIISDYLIKLLKLPVAFFETKTIGDIMQRIGDHSRIQGFISSTTLSTIFSFINFIVFGAIMAYYNLKILLFFLLGSSVYATWVALFLKKRKEFDYKLFEQNSARQTTMVQLISGIRDIKLHNFEKQKRWEWERLQAKGFKISIKQMILSQYQQVGGFFIQQAQSITISYISAKAVIDGEMTFGMMLSMQYILGQISAPISQFIGLLNTYQDAKISFERISEVHDNKDEENNNISKILSLPDDRTIKLENLNFSYEGIHGKKVLDNIDLTIPEKKITAVVGASGSGKTTLLKLLLRFYDTYEGKMKVGNYNLKNISHQFWREHCGAVMQDGFIFSDTIAANICIGDEDVDVNKLDYAAQMANIIDFINELPLGYDTKIGTDGVGISQGQRQRILIARAVYKNPVYLFFDEATNSLDTNNERVIVDNLSKVFEGKTVLIIAHRLSTVKNADQIVVMDSGKIVEVGTHKELVETKGKYFDLVKNQLELEK